HNSSYWSGIPYLGLGPGAHSFDGRQRRWNHPNLNRYIEVLGSKEVIENLGTISSGETLSDDDRYNEYIMTRLRTAKGISPQEIATRFGEERARYCHSRAQTFLKSHRLSETADRRWVLTEEGIFVSDAIIADLFC
ncbi:MAG: coproporphyrinogen III oxidase, partial [Bacteroidaceae bacterium]|nr:coproporphyrinogen III oxidase [Bacteroidaceae bacterium]